MLLITEAPGHPGGKDLLLSRLSVDAAVVQGGEKEFFCLAVLTQVELNPSFQQQGIEFPVPPSPLRGFFLGFPGQPKRLGVIAQQIERKALIAEGFDVFVVESFRFDNFLGQVEIEGPFVKPAEAHHNKPHLVVGIGFK